MLIISAGLALGTEYEVTVRAINMLGESEFAEKGFSAKTDSKQNTNFLFLYFCCFLCIYFFAIRPVHVDFGYYRLQIFLLQNGLSGARKNKTKLKLLEILEY